MSFQRSSTSSGLPSSGTRSSVHVPNRPSRPAPAPAPTPRVNTPRWVSLETPRRRDAALPLPPVPRRRAPIPLSPIEDNVEPDHAVKAAKIVEERQHGKYSLMQVSEEPGYYGALLGST